MKGAVLFSGLVLMGGFLTVDLALAVNPTGYGQAGGEFDIRVKRVPTSELAKAKRVKSPIQASRLRSSRKGKKFFSVVAAALVAMGPKGKGMEPRRKTFPFSHGILRIQNSKSTARLGNSCGC